MKANKLHNIKENPQLVSATTQLKLTAADGKSKNKTYALLQKRAYGQNPQLRNVHERY